MTKYTADFTATANALHEIEADSPEHALELARDLACHHGDTLNFEPRLMSVHTIEISGYDDLEGLILDELAVWQSDKQRLRLAGDRLMKALRHALWVIADTKPDDP